jgi:hypothetical protein
VYIDAHLNVAADHDSVEFTLAVTNADKEPVDLEFQSGKELDIAIYEDGVKVWDWSEGRMFTQAVETQTLASGETLIYEANWDTPSRGSYTAKVCLAATNVTLVERESFEVP